MESVPDSNRENTLTQTDAPSRVRNRSLFSRLRISAANVLLTFTFLLGVAFTVVFGLDLCTGWIFWRASVLMDVGFILGGLGLIFLCWEAYQDIRKGKS